MKSKALKLSLAAGILSSALFFFSAWLPLTSIGNQSLQTVSIFLIFIPLLNLFIITIASVFCISKRTRARALFIITLNIFIFLGSITGMQLGEQIRRYEFAQLAERSTPLTTAIKSFIQTENRLPKTLEELVPNYLSAIPQTGMGAYPEYDYVQAKNLSEYAKNNWILIVHCPRGLVNWDVFIYYPNSNYPKYDFGGFIKPIGDWAYVYE